MTITNPITISAHAQFRQRRPSFLDISASCEEVDAPHAFALCLDDGRLAHTLLEAVEEGMHNTTVFDPEATNPSEMQREGLQAIPTIFCTDLTLPRHQARTSQARLF